MALYNFQMEPAYSKFLLDIQDTQAEDGSIPNTVPHGWGQSSADPLWAAAYPIILWNVYRHSGDVQLLARHYPGVRKYVDRLHRSAHDYIVTYNRFGDWLGIVQTSGALISTGGFLLMVRIVANIAHKLGKRRDAGMYHDLSAKIATAFNQRFFDPEKRLYDKGSQLASLFPLYLQIVPDDFRQAVLDHLVHDIMVNHKGHLSTGFIGSRYLLDTLVQEGRADVAYHIVSQETYPGWGYMVRNGATTMWETWQADKENCSHNHPPFAFVSGWFYSTLAGLVPDEDFPGWERFRVMPHLLGELSWVKASVDTLRGKVSIRWQLTQKGVEMAVTVPANSQATVCMPKGNIRVPRVCENNCAVWTCGKFVAGTRGIAFGQDIGEWIALDVLSGEYHFSVTEDSTTD
jgi:alpha-L-rhamnosidase